MNAGCGSGFWISSDPDLDKGWAGSKIIFSSIYKYKILISHNETVISSRRNSVTSIYCYSFWTAFYLGFISFGQCHEYYFKLLNDLMRNRVNPSSFILHKSILSVPLFWITQMWKRSQWEEGLSFLSLWFSLSSVLNMFLIFMFPWSMP